MIDQLKQIEEKMLLSLLSQPDKWKTLLINYHPPVVERCWIQLGNYRIYLHFIQPCEAKDALFHPHPWPSAMHVLHGQYEMGLGFGPGNEEPPKMCTLLLENGGAYYDMTHIDGWHYVRPIGGPCATVMLAGKLWGREEVKEPGFLGPLPEDRKLLMIEWFETYYRDKICQTKIFENTKIKRGDWVELDEHVMNRQDKKILGAYIGQMGFVIGREKDSIDVRFGNDRHKIHSKILNCLDPSTKPENVEQAKKKLDDMNPDNWPDDADDPIML